LATSADFSGDVETAFADHFGPQWRSKVQDSLGPDWPNALSESLAGELGQGWADQPGEKQANAAVEIVEALTSTGEQTAGEQTAGEEAVPTPEDVPWLNASIQASTFEEWLAGHCCVRRPGDLRAGSSSARWTRHMQAASLRVGFGPCKGALLNQAW
jgi:hypothetical protein